MTDSPFATYLKWAVPRETLEAQRKALADQIAAIDVVLAGRPKPPTEPKQRWPHRTMYADGRIEEDQPRVLRDTSLTEERERIIARLAEIDGLLMSSYWNPKASWPGLKPEEDGKPLFSADEPPELQAMLDAGRLPGKDVGVEVIAGDGFAPVETHDSGELPKPQPAAQQTRFATFREYMGGPIMRIERTDGVDNPTIFRVAVSEVPALLDAITKGLEAFDDPPVSTPKVDADRQGLRIRISPYIDPKGWRIERFEHR